EQNSQGIVSIVWPSAATTRDLLIGPRGLLTYAPWLALAPFGLVAIRTRLRAEVLVAGAMVVAFMTYNSGALNPFGGWTPGPRYLMPALPFGAILVGLAPRAIRPVALVAIAVSIAIFVAATVTMPNAPESVRDPLREVWLPRLLGRDLGESNAWIRWGFHGIQPLLILLVGVVATVAGLLATEHQGERLGEGGIRRSTVVIAIQLLLIVALASPLPPMTPLQLGRDRSAPLTGVLVVDGGIDRLPPVDPVTDPDGLTSRASFWAQLENAGGPISGTRVRFSLATGDGREVWSSWFDGIDWQAGERRQLRVSWKGDATAATYRVAVAITSPDGRTTFGRAADLGILIVDPSPGAPPTRP
ncbi:MAG: hypothetical protein M3Q66_05845, partial [Chloroflexota bacterium]|nr:hypothetical protein [Chloroflexota bacterium]